MYVARVLCSDAACADERTVEIATIAELEALACDCGCTFEVIGWPDWADEEIAEAIVLRLRRGRRPGGGPLRHAA
jgi:hypothetical protein